MWSSSNSIASLLGLLVIAIIVGCIALAEQPLLEDARPSCDAARDLDAGADSIERLEAKVDELDRLIKMRRRR